MTRPTDHRPFNPGTSLLLAAVLVAWAATAAAGQPTAASLLQQVTASAFGREVTVTLRGNGPLQPAAIGTARDLPPRVVLDFHGVSIDRAVPRVTDVGRGDVQRVRVALNSMTPRITRVVVDLARASSFRVVPQAPGSDEVTVVFEPAAHGAPAGGGGVAIVATPALSPVPRPAPASPASRPAAVAPSSANMAAPPGTPAPGTAAPSPADATVASAVAGPAPTVAPAASPIDPALVVGTHVKVEGHARPDGSFDAVQVVLRDAEASVKIEGRVQSVRDDRQGLRILGFDVAYGRDLTLYRGSRPGASRAELVEGAWIEVKGVRRADRLVASRIRIKDAPETTEELESTIEQVAGAGLVVMGRPVRLTAQVPVVDERTGGEAGPDTTRLRRDDDEQARAPWRIGSRVIVGGRLESAWVEQGNFDLDDSADRRDQWVSRLQGLASAQLTTSIEAYTKVSVNRRALLQDAALLTRQDVEVQEAYVMAHRLGGSPVSVQLGRQRFRDGREWFYDEYMDAVRVVGAFGPWSVEGAVADGVLAGPVAGRDRKDKRHQLASVTRTLGGRGRASAFLVRRDDRGPADDDPLWVGGSLDAKADGGSRVWALGAARRGHRGSSRLGGWAVDTGATLALSAAGGQPSLTLGFARASGDGLSGDGRDTRFRQTDLEDNSARFGGLRRLTYYGELFDPELSNLQVLTAGLGLRPTRRVGVDVVWHTYLQSVLDDAIPSSAFDLDATEESGLLGHELDAAITIRAGRFDIDLAAGAFLTGPGLSASPRLAFFWRPQVRLYF
ncbi:MAG: alginate export family protein [Vicinamibacterales bacterium]